MGPVYTTIKHNLKRQQFMLGIEIQAGKHFARSMTNALAQISAHRLLVIEAFTFGEICFNIPRHKFMYCFDLDSLRLSYAQELSKRANGCPAQGANDAKFFQQPTRHTHRIFALATRNQTQGQKFRR